MGSRRYEKHPHCKNIRVEIKTGKLLATIRRDKRTFYKMFGPNRLADAISWLEDIRGEVKKITNLEKYPFLQDLEHKYTLFGDVVNRYYNEHVSSLGTATRQSRELLKPFFEDLNSLYINQITPTVISKHVINQKQRSIILGKNNRYSFDQEIKVLKAIFNWWREEDYKTVNPVLKKHFKLGRIKQKEKKNLKMSKDEILSFFDAIKEDEYWHLFALVHFFTAGRVSEVAGLQFENIDMKSRVIYIRTVSVWNRGSKHFIELKKRPKNEEERVVYINDILLEKLRPMLEVNSKGFVFKYNNIPLSYRKIQSKYEQFLRKAGLFPKYSGTHFMRHTMATLTRHTTNNLDAVQAVTGHKDQKLLQHYADYDVELNKFAQEKVKDLLF